MGTKHHEGVCLCTHKKYVKMVSIPFTIQTFTWNFLTFRLLLKCSIVYFSCLEYCTSSKSRNSRNKMSNYLAKGKAMELLVRLLFQCEWAAEDQGRPDQGERWNPSGDCQVTRTARSVKLHPATPWGTEGWGWGENSGGILQKASQFNKQDTNNTAVCCCLSTTSYNVSALELRVESRASGSRVHNFVQQNYRCFSYREHNIGI